MTIILGVTGGIASGKSTVSRFFYEWGFPLIDADVIAREAVAPGSSGLANIATHFGQDVLLADGSLNRKKMGDLVFKNAAARKILDNILDSDIRSRIQKKVTEAKDEGSELIIVDIPLLFEAHYEALVDQVMVVYVPSDIQLERLQIRNKLSRGEALSRLSSQMPIEEKKTLADIVIDNAGSLSQTKKQLEQWLLTNHIKTS